ncbi:hypothetical protein OIV83_002943 [Microbotryomycetes sp. JL201]|nr:hypothetical protein OIV83_002943 [Microbotryomycetes sp. JL201]
MNLFAPPPLAKLSVDHDDPARVVLAGYGDTSPTTLSSMDATHQSEFSHLLPAFPSVPQMSRWISDPSLSRSDTAPSPTLNAAAINSFTASQSRPLLCSSSDQHVTSAESSNGPDRALPFMTSRLGNWTVDDCERRELASWPDSTSRDSSRSDYLEFVQDRYGVLQGLTSSFSDEDDDDNDDVTDALFDDRVQATFMDESERYDKQQDQQSYFEDQSCQTFDHLSFDFSGSDESASPFELERDVK